MNYERSRMLQQHGQERVAAALHMGQLCKQHHMAIHARILAIHADLRAKRVPQRVISYLEGYREALTRQMLRDHVIFGAWIDGEFYSHDRTRPDSVEARGLTYREFGDLLKRPGARQGHYWKADVSKPYGDHLVEEEQ